MKHSGIGLTLSARTIAAAMVVYFGLFVSLLSADVTWNGSQNGSWNNVNNWDSGAKPYDWMSDAVVFGAVGAANKTCTNDMSMIHIGGIVFTNGGGYTLVQGAGAGNQRDTPYIYSYEGNNVIQYGVLADDIKPGLVMAANNSQLTIGNGMSWGGGWGTIRASSDSTIVLNGALASGNAVFDGPGNYVLNGSMSLGGQLYLTAGTITLNANDTLSGSMFDGNALLIAGGGARSFSSGNLLGMGGDFLFGGTNDFTFSGGIGRQNAHPNINVTNPVVRVTVLNGASVYPNDDVLTTKKGPGTLVIKGATGLNNNRKFQVDAGTLLLVDGSYTWVNSANDAITVASGGTLGGTNATVNLGGTRVVRVQSGGTLNPGDPRVNNGIGALTLGTSGSQGDTILESGSTLRIDVGAGTADALAVNGNLTLTGSSLDLNQVVGTKPVSGTHTIATYSGARTGTFSSTNYNGTARYQITYNGTSNGSILLDLTVPANGTVVVTK